MSARCIVLACVALLATAAVADENLVYETLSGVEIGRVFLSREERAVLDEQRKHPASDGATVSGTSPLSESVPQAAASAGYIIGQNGLSKVWKDGDFVTSLAAPATALRFPGEVKIIRHAAVDERDPPDEVVTPADGDD